MSASLMDELACAGLMIAWSRHVDLHENDAIAGLFAEDAVLHAPGGVQVEGRAAILAALSTRSPNRVTRHMLAPPFIRLTGPDAADGITGFTVYEGFKDQYEGDGPMALRAPVTVGEFHQTYRRTAEGWRIASHRSVPVFKHIPTPNTET